MKANAELILLGTGNAWQRQSRHWTEGYLCRGFRTDFTLLKLLDKRG